ncbi:MAG: hypothetical protein M3417_10075 [Actinomycetota bacterium]|nr:hypothetical protein [Actinomycetota bacterium]
MHWLLNSTRSRGATQNDTQAAGPRPGHDAGAGSGRESTHHTPRWVKVSGVIALAVVVMLVVMIVAGGGQHGPGRHAPSGAQPQQSGGHTPSPGGHR